MGISAVSKKPEIVKNINIEMAPHNSGPDERQTAEPSKHEWPGKGAKVASSEAKAKEIIERLNQALAMHEIRLEFSVHEKTQAIMVKVVDENTGEIIREAPPEKVLDMISMIWDETGLIVDEKA